MDLAIDVTKSKKRGRCDSKTNRRATPIQNSKGLGPAETQAGSRHASPCLAIVVLSVILHSTYSLHHDLTCVQRSLCLLAGQPSISSLTSALVLMLATTVKRATRVERGRADRIGACTERTASRGQRGELSSACDDAGLLVMTCGGHTLSAGAHAEN